MTKHATDIQFNANPYKIIHSILYVINHLGGSVNKYNLMKIMFEADKQHMIKYMRPVTGDKYMRMNYGTVPSKTLNIVNGQHLKRFLKKVEMDSLPFKLKNKESNILKLVGNKQADRNYLSKSDIDALDKGIKKYGRLSFAEVLKKNHQEKCWINTPKNKQIPYEVILEGNQDIIEFLKENSRVMVI